MGTSAGVPKPTRGSERCWELPDGLLQPATTSLTHSTVAFRLLLQKKTLKNCPRLVDHYTLPELTEATLERWSEERLIYRSKSSICSQTQSPARPNISFQSPKCIAAVHIKRKPRLLLPNRDGDFGVFLQSQRLERAARSRRFRVLTDRYPTEPTGT